MIIPKEVQCRTCSQVFCCATCRKKHEDVKHQEIAMLRKICYICNDRPFPLRKDTKVTPNNLLIAHVLNEHLPLQCNRCRKVFYSMADFQDASKCFLLCTDEPGKEGECHLQSSSIIDPDSLPPVDDENKENVATKCSITEAVSVPVGLKKEKDLQPTSEAEEVDDALLTPLTKINLRWKRKSRQSFESMLSMTNNTSEVNASGILRGEGAGGARKLVRTTSTPMYQWQLMPTGLKQPNESYTMGQMSSIHCSSGSETDSRTEDPVGSPVKPNELDKVRAIIRNRSKAVATPLRQVMSKSIQRAIAQHTGAGGAYSKMLQPGTQRKMSFNSTVSSGVNSTIASPGRHPLDLRTTPVLRRVGGIASGASSQAHPMVRMGDPGQETVQLAGPVTTDDGEKSRSLPNVNSDERSEYYETHRDMESLRRSNDSMDAENQDSSRKMRRTSNYLHTPKITGGALKKVISFQGLQRVTLTKGHSPSKGDAEEDVWGTPCAGAPNRSYSCSAAGLGETFRAYDASVEDAENDTLSDDVFYPSKVQLPEQRGVKATLGNSALDGKGKLDDMMTTGGSRLWSIVSNVIRLASRSDVQEEVAVASRGQRAVTASSGSTTSGIGLMQRAASFADYLKSRYTGANDGLPRTSSSGSDEYRVTSESVGKKRRRIASSYSRGGPPATLLVNVRGSKSQYSPLAKRKRIQSRQPIQRMRHTSSDSVGSASSTNGQLNSNGH
ncbi:mitosis initiation protein fs(1)Ya [Anopheles nili]|uniref:mitosis initiation protein fs(1)Ya n=1 Tax=Anopheles nili TaxID=185578 RepID=UPI00237AB776|nr:mitosis initiation protein fs(1)Ya [Anopheles nili]